MLLQTNRQTKCDFAYQSRISSSSTSNIKGNRIKTMRCYSNDHEWFSKNEELCKLWLSTITEAPKS